MKDNTATINRFFPFDELAPEQLSQIADSDDFKPLREKISKELKGMPIPGSFFETMIKQISDLLRIDIRAILLSAYSKSEEILKFLDQQNYPAEETVLIPLAEHTILSQHAPSLRPVINQIPLGEIQFHLNLEMVLKGAVLKIQGGKFMGLSIGSGGMRGVLQYNDMPILEKEGDLSEGLTSLELGEGIPVNDTVENIHSKLGELLGDDTGDGNEN